MAARAGGERHFLAFVATHRSNHHVPSVRAAHRTSGSGRLFRRLGISYHCELATETEASGLCDCSRVAHLSRVMGVSGDHRVRYRPHQCPHPGRLGLGSVRLTQADRICHQQRPAQRVLRGRRRHAARCPLAGGLERLDLDARIRDDLLHRGGSAGRRRPTEAPMGCPGSIRVLSRCDGLSLLPSLCGDVDPADGGQICRDVRGGRSAKSVQRYSAGALVACRAQRCHRVGIRSATTRASTARRAVSPGRGFGTARSGRSYSR